jgi:putative transposase
MPRTKRVTPGGMVYHVLNRGVGQMALFRHDDDYRAFLRVVGQSLRLAPMRICGFCLMPNHWHLLLWPKDADDLPRFMQRLTNTHVQRWQKHRRRVGQGHVYQGRYKSFPVEEGDHYFQVLRYIERNALRAGLVERAQDWKWCSLSRWKSPEPDEAWPLVRPLPCGKGWTRHVNQPQTEAEAAAIRQSIRRGRPLGSSGWVEQTARRLGLTSTLRERGRPKAKPPENEAKAST